MVVIADLTSVGFTNGQANHIMSNIVFGHMSLTNAEIAEVKSFGFTTNQATDIVGSIGKGMTITNAETTELVNIGFAPKQADEIITYMKTNNTSVTDAEKHELLNLPFTTPPTGATNNPLTIDQVNYILNVINKYDITLQQAYEIAPGITPYDIILSFLDNHSDKNTTDVKLAVISQSYENSQSVTTSNKSQLCENTYQSELLQILTVMKTTGIAGIHIYEKMLESQMLNNKEFYLAGLGYSDDDITKILTAYNAGTYGDLLNTAFHTNTGYVNPIQGYLAGIKYINDNMNVGLYMATSVNANGNKISLYDQIVNQGLNYTS